MTVHKTPGNRLQLVILKSFARHNNHYILLFI